MAAALPQSPTIVPLPPPPPPPMPGTSGSSPMPNWRDLYPSQLPSSIRHEHPPSKQEIEKQQYAHLPDKLLNAMNKDKKPFTYTPSGVSSEKGVLDLSEIRSPRMKKRLLANLHAGEDDNETEQLATTKTDSLPNQSKSPNAHQYTASPFVLPPIPADAAQKLRPSSPSGLDCTNNSNNNNKKEVRFAPSPIPMLSCDDNELVKKLAARKQDVESRATIVTNNPIDEDTDNNNSGQQQQQPNFPSSTQQKIFESDVNQLCLNAAEAVRTARGITEDSNNNPIYNNPCSNQMNELNETFQKQLQFEPYTPVPVQENLQQQTPTAFNTDVLKHVLDSGLQDEIDKFEEMGAKMGSTSPNLPTSSLSQDYSSNRMNYRGVIPPPIPPKPHNLMDGRTSCPPNPSSYNNGQQQNDFINSYRCISPSVDIWKRTQQNNSSNGYNYSNSKPRPFNRSMINQPPMQTFQPLSNERSKMMDNGYSASLPRKIKLGQEPQQLRSYDNTESGREYLQQAGMFSQLPPNQVDSPTQSKMFFGINSRQQQQQQQQPLFESEHAQTYVDPEINREYLTQAGMFSQLPPSTSQQTFTTIKSRQSSLPPLSNGNGYGKNGPESPIGTPPINPWKQMAQINNSGRRLSMSELRKLPPSERPHESAPLKYTGANIPSRAFRILQLITGEDVPNQFVQEQENDQRIDQQQQQSRRPKMPPPPPPPRSDSYRPASQQSFQIPTSRFEQYEYQQTTTQQTMIPRPESAIPMIGNYYQSQQHQLPLNNNNYRNQQFQQPQHPLQSTVYSSSAHGTDF
uniref:Probable basic-leucine zipper transcription factor R n=1 Tax=Dermatophagoides pteronyssinus TaxID=6956 RepID=A0A6P6XTB4_DERPT|nr:probable basic-leucine zipper transcription factor R [Dermatophagoides pteronyssinus]